MVDLVAFDPTYEATENLDDFDLDMQFGDDQNDFTLTPYQGGRLDVGWLIGMEGGEYGGIIGKMLVSTASDATAISYEGDTWHGILAKKILSPDKGQDYLKASGEANTVLAQLISRVNLGTLFVASTKDSGLSLSGFQFERYTDMYTGVRKMLDSVGGKLRIVFTKGKVTLSAERSASITDTVDNDVMDFTLTRDSRRVNHLIGLGEGELKARAVSDWYADTNGKVSQTQSLFGLDEVAAIYDYSSAKASELATETKKKLTELQGQGDIDVTVHEGTTFDIGDQVTGRDNVTGTLVSAKVSKKIVKVNAGILSVSYEVGQDSTAESLSGTAESTPGGRIYIAGEGLNLADDGVTFNADVTQTDLDDVKQVATEAQTTASNLSADVGKAQGDASKAVLAAADAQSTASSASTAVSTAVQKVTAAAPLKATRNGNDVSLSASEASATAAGMMSAADKAKLDGIEESANAYTLPTATTTTIGGVRPDGKTIKVSADGTLTAQTSGGGGGDFLAAWPVGSIYQSASSTNPGDTYGGTWERMPSLGAFTWERKA